MRVVGLEARTLLQQDDRPVEWVDGVGLSDFNSHHPWALLAMLMLTLDSA